MADERVPQRQSLDMQRAEDAYRKIGVLVGLKKEDANRSDDEKKQVGQLLDWLGLKDQKERDKFLDKRDGFVKKYVSRSKDVGALIMTSGLGAALAFLRAKDDAARLLYDHISTWVLGNIGKGQSNRPHLLAVIMDERNDTAYYRRATTEAIAYATWLKRFVEGEFPKEAQEAAGGNE